jgi:hypothetical protein
VLFEYRYDGKDTYEKKVEKYWYFPPVSMTVIVAAFALFVIAKKKQWSWKKVCTYFRKK